MSDIRVHVEFKYSIPDSSFPQRIPTSFIVAGNMPVQAFSLLLRQQAKEFGTDTKFTIIRMEEIS